MAIVKAALVSAKTRFQDDRRELTVIIPETELVKEYWGQGIARGLVFEQLCALNLKSHHRVLSWVCTDGVIIQANGEKNASNG
ncbi:hypothetical protein VIBNIFTn2_1110048 [Vibrio nigripulchritudo FTn2]|uniref:hypothetical protein n=1 Tax=Vibrio nigripulchritudo TaxID=28173 RepID=UPI0003B23974|nr:hypothetical protein [Vibrio nigripulchritudo]BCL74165.1 hypothetical protein VNTUMSATTG_61020 [Vibrio nigripulchritudo]CCN39750.1 hypothetical protein VIBNIFTn2_1110048 [Vibrio nigripulchritudo FTn2]